MEDQFQLHAQGLESPATQHFGIVPSDTAFLATIPRALYANTSGTATLEDRAGAVITYNLIAGQILPFRAVRVRATGTSAALIGWA
ncbi:hypothetical protein GCM10011452_06890 [Gemmobacter lanyuensis]|uniref:Uncharacterized protein n=1 Tax=Gemmobacter lanyuensis TaxID=1054497 RepID=A0A918MGS8_9RHOB|nr:hypothetical protein [Gemmobacter lanyuensis]GGW22806.1 hypothetical protein GCM10011452_06890 [Gemmobacter lanyuensis]